MMRNDGIKQCWECHSELPKSEFYYDKDFPDGLYPVCVYCIREVRENKRKLEIKVKGLGRYL